MDSHIVLIVIEIVLAGALLYMFHAARKALSVDDARRAAMEEAERLAESVEKLANRIEEAADRALCDLGKSIERAERLVEQLEAAADSARPHVVEEGAREQERGPKARAADKRAQVLELAAAGMKPGAIAKKMDIGVGEVELMLDLSRRAEAAPQGGLFAGGDAASPE